MKIIIALVGFSFFQPYLDAAEISIVAVGDIMLARYIGKDMERKGHRHPFEKMKVIISSADIAFGNLECPISGAGSPTKDKFCFRASTQAVKGLVYSGFDILCLANNHSMDYGKKALLETIKILKENHILTTGSSGNYKLAQEPAILNEKGIKVGFLSYDCAYLEMYDIRKSSLSASPREIISRDIATAKQKADIVAVSFHWGKEYSEKPSKLQIKLAHGAIDSGADLILGHHPHVLQGIEFYKDKPVIYSLGNFIFDQKFGNTGKGIAVKFVFNEKKLYKVICMPITRNYDNYYPQIASETDKKKIKQSIMDISMPLNLNPEISNNLYFE